VEVRDLAPGEQAFDPKGYFPHETTDLSPAMLQARMDEIDKNFEEPRSSAKVAYSYETCRLSISRVNDYGALWRGARACSWLAVNHPDRSQRLKFAEEGAAMGRAAVRKTSTRVESFYYLALCQIALLDLSSYRKKGAVEEIETNLKIAIVLDETFDHCGPHRFFGHLLADTHDSPLLGVTSLKRKAQGVQGALEHMRKATESCPEYGENHLALAQVLIQAEQFDLARAQLEHVIASEVPEDRSAEHETWLEDANELLMDLQGK
jgi:hypothetical protein